MSSLRAPLAEFLGTFFLCFAGIAAILSNTAPVGGNLGIVGIALAHGLALSVAVNAFGGISGAHFNPAVTAGMLATGRISASNAVVYLLFQLAGATAAAAICKAVFPAAAVAGANLGIPLPAAWASTSVVVILEFVMTFLLMTAIFGTAIDARGQAVKIGGFGIGLTVTFDILAGGAVTGASMNPARSFGPAFMQNYWAWHPLYWIAPIAGAVTAALVYQHLILETKGPRP
jgi:MIP family channel proteins